MKRCASRGGGEGSCQTVCHHAQKWRQEHACGQSDAFIPLQFAPGEAYQFDWCEEFVRIGGCESIIFHRIKLERIRWEYRI